MVNDTIELGIDIVIFATCCILIYLILFAAKYLDRVFLVGWKRMGTEIKLSLSKKEEAVLQVEDHQETKLRKFHKWFWISMGILYIVGFALSFIIVVGGILLTVLAIILLIKLTKLFSFSR